MAKLLKYLTHKDKAFIFISLIFIVVGVWFDLELPDYMSEITTLVQTEGSQMSDIVSSGIGMLIMALGSLITSVIVGFLVAKVAANLGKTLRNRTYEKTMSFSKEEISKFSIPSLITRSTNDITQVQLLITLGLQATIKAPILALWAISKIVGKSYEWSLAAGISVLLILAVFAALLILAVPRMSKIQTLTDSVNRVSRESIMGVRAVRAYNAESYQENKFFDINNSLTKENLFVNRTFALLQPAMTLIMMGLSLAIYIIGAYIIEGASPNDKLFFFSEMIVFSSYAVQVIMAFLMLAISFMILPRSVVSAKRINEVLDTKSKIIYGTKDNTEVFEKGTLEFRNVSFMYPNAEEATLVNINFTAKKGETVAFIGSTGSGKSTLIDLIPRFYDPTDGEIFIDGLDIREYTKETLMSKLGYVSQKAVMFSNTVEGNITYGDDFIDEEEKLIMQKSAEIAMASEFISNMDSKFGSHIAQGGTNVSGGQKQRLSIARAIYKRPEIYIFDDSFSALDYKTDRILRANLKKHFGGTTKLIVAQRVGTIMDADKIIVLDNGKIVGMGTHKELLKSCEVYLEIASSQLSQEEIENAN